MAELKFREPRADEVEVRVGTIGEKGVSLLLYKDARFDQTVLDETVTPMKWRNSYERDEAGRLFCTIGIFDSETNQWIEKSNCGIPSKNEAEKGEASDAFKRAGFNWGIGRSLYSSPFIWFNADEINLSEKDGKKVTFDHFAVEELEIVEGKITKVIVTDTKTKVTKTFYGKSSTKEPAKTTTSTKKSGKTESSKETSKVPETPETPISPVSLGDYKITIECAYHGKTLDEIYNEPEEKGLKFMTQVMKYSSKPSMKKDAIQIEKYLETKKAS